MNESILTWNVTNWITVLTPILMAMEIARVIADKQEALIADKQEALIADKQEALTAQEKSRRYL